MAIYSNSASKIIQQHTNLKPADKGIIRVLLFVLLIACIETVLLPRINNDTAFQTGQILSFIKGNGFTISKVTSNDISLIEYSRSGEFAPGYLWLATPLMYLFTIRTSIAIVNVFSVILFCLSYCAIIRLLTSYTHRFFVPASLLFISVIPILFEFCAATDLLSLAFYFLTIYLIIKLILSVDDLGKSRIFYLTCAISVSSFFTCFFRYAYYPFLIIPLFVLLVTSIFYNKKLFKPLIIYIVLVCSLLMLQLTYQGGDDYITNRHSNSDLSQLHWENLLYFENFMFNAFVNESFFNTLLEKIHIPAKAALLLKQITTLGIIVALIWGVFKMLRSVEIIHPSSKRYIVTPFNLFCFIGLLTISVNVLFLVALSVRYELYDWGVRKWTYVQEMRYYAPSMIFLVTFSLLKLFFKQKLFPRYIKYVIVLFVFISFLINGLYQPLRVYSLYKKNKKSDQILLLQLPDIINSYKTLPSVIVASDGTATYTDYARMSGAAYCDARILLGARNKPSGPVHLFIFIPQMSTFPELDNGLKEFISKQRAKKIMNIKTYGNTEVFYTQYK